MGERLRRVERGDRQRRSRFETLTVGENYHRLLDAASASEKPDAIIHFAEQRAAPYSMKSPWHKRYTVNNNLNATNDVLCAIVESGQDIHLVHLGTMGVYGYGTAGMKIPEGYLKVKVDTAEGPTDAGDPVSGQSRLDLSHDQDAGSAVLPLLQQERRGQDHRPASGHRLGHADRGDPAWTSG